MLKWSHDYGTLVLIRSIAERAVALAEKNGLPPAFLDKQSTMMDIDATHSNGCPLKLLELLEADDSNFAHDVFGIRTNLNRTTGQLGNFFVARYASTRR